MDEKKGCFGVLDKIFPVSNNGLREIQSECFQCPDRLSCLKTAISTEDGIKMREDILDRTASNGFFSRIKRWSMKKELYRVSKQEKMKNKKWWR